MSPASNTYWRKRTVALVILFYCALFALPHAGFAGMFTMESESLFSVRNGDDFKLKSPLFELWAASYITENRRLEVNTNLGLFGDPMDSRSDVDLYLLNIAYHVIPDRMTLRLGRTFDTSSSIGAISSDSLDVGYSFFKKRLKIGFFGGVEREPEDDSFNADALIFGPRIIYRSDRVFPLSVGAKYLYRHYRVGAKSSNHFVQIVAGKPFAWKWSPEFLFDAEMDVRSFDLRNLELGVDLYPSLKTVVSLRFLTHNEQAYEGIEKPLFAIFSMGRLYESRVMLGYQFTSSFSSSVAFAFDDYLIQESKHTQGYRLECGAQYSSRRLNVADTAYFVKSYGGNLYGDRVFFRERISKRIEFLQGVDVAYYEKVTSSKRFAFSSRLGGGIWFTDRLKFDLYGEFNDNNVLSYDYRVVGKLTYMLWAGT